VQNRKLRVFKMNVLRRIISVSGRGRRRNVYVRAELGVVRDLMNKIRHQRLTYFGHVVRMAPLRTSNMLLHGRVKGTRPRGRQKKRWLNVFREHCKIIVLTLLEAEHLATTRRVWSRAVFWLLERVDLLASSKH